jgi:hypothetical protein
LRTNAKRKANKRQLHLDFAKLPFIWVPYLHKGKRKNQNDTNYHSYSIPTPSRKPQAADRGRNNANESKAGHTLVQRAST